MIGKYRILKSLISVGGKAAAASRTGIEGVCRMISRPQKKQIIQPRRVVLPRNGLSPILNIMNRPRNIRVATTNIGPVAVRRNPKTRPGIAIAGNHRTEANQRAKRQQVRVNATSPKKAGIIAIRHKRNEKLTKLWTSPRLTRGRALWKCTSILIPKTT
ncbi:unnamed protein product, partial [Nesidiocoris tenuis]